MNSVFFLLNRFCYSGSGFELPLLLLWLLLLLLLFLLVKRYCFKIIQTQCYFTEEDDYVRRQTHIYIYIDRQRTPYSLRQDIFRWECKQRAYLTVVDCSRRFCYRKKTNYSRIHMWWIRIHQSRTTERSGRPPVRTKYWKGKKRHKFFKYESRHLLKHDVSFDENNSKLHTNAGQERRETITEQDDRQDIFL